MKNYNDIVTSFVLITIVAVICLIVLGTIKKVTASDFKNELIKSSAHVDENPCNSCLRLCE